MEPQTLRSVLYLGFRAYLEFLGTGLSRRICFLHGIKEGLGF